ncbi:hypothetical protein FA04_29240 (plasmid) [Ensifer adhaerens]|jgi:hypothetical protein|uniref:Uncharacterized protein n=1 Tax=Ensifer adhaerens TaxID=106592 RepID=A0A9Q9DDG8_ENSAD|nr:MULTISPECIES: hypothetical protein [Ensifer]ANK76792.1 hypothetical protein FA04_29240 [Ensifer adhaerens]KDP73212.1 hypothetical protein FA04_13415 [Ensifer adhaerens]OKP71783.1 hypothetical protein BTE77_24995 [Ensifer adhaerens]USJ27281.1 hypothetical protein NE863_32910 [Ensifer adhaerens]WFP95218.1 hypothetical protein P4B07_29670 [Ensifer adhaerens]
MTENDRRQMKATEVPAFVDDVIEAGCNICAVGQESYVIGDIDEQEAGDRDLIRLEIVDYLWSIGRYMRLPPRLRGTSGQRRPA